MTNAEQPFHWTEKHHRLFAGERRRRRAMGAIVAFLALLGSANGSFADWPANRHDASRSGTADGKSHIAKPAVAWRHYLGGSLAVNQLVMQDVDRDGNGEVIYISSGRLNAKTLDDRVVWQSPSLELTRIEAVLDFDGDGSKEVLAASVTRLHLINLADGKVAWTLPAGHVGSPGAVRVADFDRDGKLDVYVADTACGSLESLGDAGEAWSFGSGLTAGRVLFQLERGKRDYACGINDVVADVNGDGQLDVIAQGINFFYVYSGSNGVLISASESVGSLPYGEAQVEAANVDGDPASELVCYTNTNYPPPLNSRRVFLLDWDSANSRLVRRWERAATDPAKDRHAYGVGGVGDLEADGTLEVVTSFYSAPSDSWTTVVLDAASGAQRGAAPRGPFQGLLDLDGDSKPEVVVGDRILGTSVFKWNADTLTAWYRAPRFEPLVVLTRDATALTGMTSGLLSLDLTRSPPNELLGLSFGADGTTAEAVVGLAGANGTPREVARRSFGEGISAVGTAKVKRTASSAPQILISRNDGYLWLLDEALAPTNALREGAPLDGLQVGGYYSGTKGIGKAPLAGDLNGDGASEVVVVDSRDVIVAIDAKKATMTQVPLVSWEIPGARFPVLLDVDNDRKYEVAYWTTTANAASLKLVRGSDTARLWQRSLGSLETSPLNDIMVGDVSGDRQVDLVYTMFSSSDGSLRINALRGLSGGQLWQNDYSSIVAGSGFGSGALFDRDGDGALDVLASPSNLLQWVSGPTGAAGPSVVADYADYGVFANLDADPASELIGSGALLGVNSFELDLTPRWKAPSTQQARINGALVRCSETSLIYVSGHDASGRVSSWDVGTGTILGDVVLAGGAASKLSDPVPANVGRVGTISVSSDLTGAARPSVLVPSTDGFLYAINPCAMSLDWALDLKAPVGEAILADTDGDKEDEIVVTVGDGFVYGIDSEVFPAPKAVYDSAGTSLANADTEVDVVASMDTLYANWEPVAGATKYEYSIIGPDGTSLTKGFVSAGTATSVTASNLVLDVGSRYVVAVRATGAPGISAEVLSDGVVVVNDLCSACGEGTECKVGKCVAIDEDASVDEESDASVDPESDAGLPGSCEACGKGTKCKDGVCVAGHRSGGCCSVAGGGSSALAPYLAGLFVALVGMRLLRRRRS